MEREANAGAAAATGSASAGAGASAGGKVEDNDTLQAAEAALEPIHGLTISTPLYGLDGYHIKDDDPDAVSDAGQKL